MGNGGATGKSRMANTNGEIIGKQKKNVVIVEY